MENRHALRNIFEENLRIMLANPEPTEAEMGQAARSFDAFAREALRAAGWPPSAKMVAAVVEEHLPDYYTVLHGRRCTARRLLVWYAKWTIVFTSGRPSVLPADLPTAPPAAKGVEAKIPTISDGLQMVSESAQGTVASEVWIRLGDGTVMHATLSEV